MVLRREVRGWAIVSELSRILFEGSQRIGVWWIAAADVELHPWNVFRGTRRSKAKDHQQDHERDDDDQDPRHEATLLSREDGFEQASRLGRKPMR